MRGFFNGACCCPEGSCRAGCLWEDLTQLNVLSLQNNALTGRLSPSWGKGMRALSELRLAFNNVKRCANAKGRIWKLCFQPTLRHCLLVMTDIDTAECKVHNNVMLARRYPSLSLV